MANSPLLRREGHLLYFQCPHCEGEVEIDQRQLNCRIFRHGVLRENGQQINPHARFEECERLRNEARIWGCGGPFRAVGDGAEMYLEICGYDT